MGPAKWKSVEYFVTFKVHFKIFNICGYLCVKTMEFDVEALTVMSQQGCYNLVEMSPS